MKPYLLTLIAVLLAPTLLVGCGGQRMSPYISDNLVGGDGGRIAILPFDNLSADQRAAKTLETMVMVEFLKQTSMNVIDPGVVHEALVQERVRLATAIPRANLISLGERLGVDIFIIGIVHEYAMQRATGAGGVGDVPAISLTLRALDAKSGEILWALSANKRGNDRESVFGIGRINSLDRLSNDTARDAARVFASSLRR